MAMLLLKVFSPAGKSPWSTAAHTLEGTGAYLQETSWESMVEDLTGLIRRYPLRSLLIGFGIGYLLACNMEWINE